jgi:hypothetical protein
VLRLTVVEQEGAHYLGLKGMLLVLAAVCDLTIGEDVAVVAAFMHILKIIIFRNLLNAFSILNLETRD